MWYKLSSILVWIILKVIHKKAILQTHVKTVCGNYALPVLVQASEMANPPPTNKSTPHGIFFSITFQVTKDGDFFGSTPIGWNGQNL